MQRRKDTLIDWILNILEECQPARLTAREIAARLIAKYPDHYAEKEAKMTSCRALEGQVAAEVGAKRQWLLKVDTRLRMKDKPRPRLYWLADEAEIATEAAEELVTQQEQNVAVPASQQPLDSSRAIPLEEDLYQPLIDFLNQEQDLVAQRIDEKRSRNAKGAGGNQWLHPDVVALQPMPEAWNRLVKDVVLSGGGLPLQLLSYEVKRKLTRSNIRQHFFQTVSNSSWANEGYLVAVEIDERAEKELRMLSTLHGIGFILLDPENPTESDVMLPARPKTAVDWESVNRLVDENKDFKQFIEGVETYLKTGKLVAFGKRRRS